MFERFTDRARRVVVLSQEETRRLGHDNIGTEHLLLGLSEEGTGVGGRALAECGVEPDALRAQIEELVGRGTSTPSGHIPFTPEAKKALELSLREALALHHTYIGTEHVLLGVLRENSGPATEALRRLGAEPADIEAKVMALIGETGAGETAPAGRRRLGMLRRSVGRSGTLVPAPSPEIGHLTIDARRVLWLARSEALRLGHAAVGSVHVLLGVLAEGEGRGARALAKVGITIDGARAAAAQVVGPPGEVPDPLVVSADCNKVVEAAVSAADDAGLRLADSGHLVVGLAKRAEDGDAQAAALIGALGTTVAGVRDAVDDLGPAA